MPSEPALPPDAPPRPRAPRRRRRWPLVLGVLVLGLATLVLSRARVLGPVLVDLFGDRLERLTGCRVEVRRVSGSWLGGLTLEGLELVGRQEGAPLRYLRGTARFEYSLLDLLGGDLGALSRLEVDLEDLVLDLRGEGPGNAAAPEPPELLPPGTWRVRAGELRLPGEQLLELEELLVELGEARDPVRAERAPSQETGLSLHRLALRRGDDLVWDGRADLRGRWRAGLLEIASLDFASRVDDLAGGVRQGRLDLRGLSAGALAFRLPLDTLGGIVVLEGGRVGRRWSLRAGARELHLDPLEALAGRLVPGEWIERWPGGVLEAALSLRFELPSAGGSGAAPDGDLEFRLRDGWALGHPCDLLRARAHLGPAGLVLEEADLVGPVFEATLLEPLSFGTSTPLDLSRGPWPDTADLTVAGTIDGSVHDLPTFLAGPIGRTYGLLPLLPDPLEPVSGCVDVHLDLEGPWEDLRADLELEAYGLRTEDVAWGDARVRLEAWRGHLALPWLELEGPLGDFAGGLAFEGPGRGHLWLGGRIDDLEHLARVVRRFGPDLPLSGAGGLDLTWHRALRYGHLDLRARSDELRYGEVVLRGLDARVSGDPWNLLVERALVALDRRRDGRSVLPHGAVTASLPAGSGTGLRLDESGRWTLEGEGLLLRAGGRTLELEGRAGAAYDFANGEFRTSPLRLSVGQGRVELTGQRRRGQLSADLGFVEFDSAPWLAPFLPEGVSVGQLDGGLQLEGPPGAGTLRADLEAHGLRLEPWVREGRAWLRLQQAGDLLVLERLELDAPGVGRAAVEGRLLGAVPGGGSLLTDRPGTLRLDARLDDPTPLWSHLSTGGLPAGLTTAGELRLQGELRGDGKHLTGTVELRGRGLLASTGSQEDGAAPGSERRAWFGPAELDARLELGPEGPRLVRAHLRSRELRAEGALQGTGPVPQDPRALAAYLRELETDERATLTVPDLDWLAPWLPGLRRTSGSLVAALPPRAERRPEAPLGRITLADGLLRFRGSELFVQDLAGELGLDRGRLLVTGLTGEFGAARLGITGSVELAGASPVLDLELRAEDMLLARDRGLRIRADTGAPGEAGLRVAGPLEALQVSGRLALRGSRFTRPYDLLGWLSRREQNAPETGEGIRLRLAEEGPLANMRLDVRISGGDPFRIDNNLVEASLRPDLRLLGTGSLAYLQGPIYIDPSRINLPSGWMDVTGGTVVFGEENPFVPRLDIAAEQRIRGYDITLSVSGTTREPEVTISSNPPLPGDDVFVLLLTGQIPRGSWGDRTERAGQVLAVYLAKDALVRAFGDDGSTGESPLDRLELTMGEDVSRQGVETMHLSYRVGPRTRGTGMTQYLTAERDEFDKENFGFRVLFRFR